MSKLTEARSRGRSLSVKQLIDERIKKLEEQQIAEIDAEYSQKHASLENSIRVKALKLKNDLLSIDSLEETARALEQSVKVKVGVLLDILIEKALDKHELGIHREHLHDSLHKLGGTSNSFGDIVNIDAYVEEIIQFDDYIKSQFSQSLGPSNPAGLDEVVSNRVFECLHSTIVDGICGSLRRGPDMDCLIPELPAHGTAKPTATRLANWGDKMRSSRANPDLQEGLEGAKTLVKKLQSNSELEYQIQRQVDEELVPVDGKYLKLIAEATYCLYEDEMRLSNTSTRSALDPLWAKKVLPVIMKGDGTIIKDFVRILSAYVSQQYPINRRIQKLVQIESAKAVFN